MSRLLQEFLNSKSDFSIIYKTSSNILLEGAKRICILDSSFNPPHMGHFSLIKESLEYDYKSALNKKSVLLLLSVKNADKIKPRPAHFSHRIEMMIKLADHINQSFDVNVNVGLTNHAKFADKSKSVIEYIKSQNASLISKTKLTFLVGFDTLVRILDAKYYTPEPLSVALGDFFNFSDIFCLTRSDGSFSIEEQNDYIKSISNGEKLEVPKQWASNIYLVQNEEADISNISSSNIRSNVQQDNNNWHNKVTCGIQDYIDRKKIYKE